MSAQESQTIKKVPKHMSLVVFGYYATPKMAEILVKKGLVKNEDRAMAALRLVAFFFFTATILISVLYVFRWNPLVETPTNEQILESMGINKSNQ